MALGLAPYVLLPAVLLASLKGVKKGVVAPKEKVIKGGDAIKLGGIRRNPAEGDAVPPRTKQFNKDIGAAAAGGLAISSVV